MYQVDRQAFGAFVASLRKDKGYTQKELAQRLHITDKAVSKWETGASIPDTALLIPLAEELGVTVTELLLCRRQERDMAAEDVDGVVRAALDYAGEKPRRAWREKSLWPLWYVLALAAGCVELWLCWRLGLAMEGLVTPVLLGAGFGAYFCFFALLRLPPLYDQYPMSFFHDGPIRMNLPGVTINNRNWPHIVNVGRVWCCSAMAGVPLVGLLLGGISPALWAAVQLAVVLTLTLGGLFIPMYVVGKKYQ